jgi:hypothetical protein
VYTAFNKHNVKVRFLAPGDRFQGKSGADLFFLYKFWNALRIAMPGLILELKYTRSEPGDKLLGQFLGQFAGDFSDNL